MTNIPSSMTAIAINGKGGPEVLVPRDVPVPEAGPGQVLIKVKASGVNRPDVLQRKGLYPAPKGHSELPGLEVAGTVAAVGSGVTRFKEGDRVMALTNGGGYAEYCLADEGVTITIPAGMDDTTAAAIPETFFTVWHNVFERGALKAGETILIHGGTSGIGVTAIQLATVFGARVIATAGSAEKCAACVSLGADRAIDYRQEEFADVIKAETQGKGVDVILDMVGGDYIDKNIRSLADDGRLVNIAYLNGSKAEIDFMRVMLKRLTITGSTLRVRTPEVKAAIARAVEENCLPLVALGSDPSQEKSNDPADLRVRGLTPVKILIDSTYPLARASDAHARMESSAHIGKIVLVV